MGHDTITQTLQRRREKKKKKGKTMSKNTGKGFFCFFLIHPSTNFRLFASQKLAISCLHNQTQWKEASDQQSFYTKDFFFLPATEAGSLITWLALETGY